MIEFMIEVLAPYSLTDLLHLVCRPTAAGRKRPSDYLARVTGKAWQQRWPRLLVIEPAAGLRFGLCSCSPGRG